MALKVYAEVGYEYLVMPDHVPKRSADPDDAAAFAYCFGYIHALMQVLATTAMPGAIEL